MLEWYRKKDPKATLVTGENASRNNQMSSPMVQKDLARACAEETIELIKSEIGDRWFAVLVDEAHDASIKEQMVVVVRFVNDKGSVIERFLSIEHVSDTTSTSLKEALDTMLRRYGLSISKIRGQGYDGASNMRGQFHGLQRLLVGDLRIFIDEVRNDDNFDTCTDLGNLAEKMVQTGRDTTFPLVYHLIELALILPVAIATVE
nr:uncharacterized protein LOC117848067 [Setaria viridis]